MIPIGIIHTPYKSKEDCPIQPAFTTHGQSQVEVFPQFAAGLKDIETFSHIYLLYQFDCAAEIQLVRPTFLDDTPRGIFASRHPCRPNNIGLSIVRLVRREGGFLFVDGADVLDQTPLLDIKPYLPKYDAFPTANEGWTGNLQWRPKPEGRE
jgi:tRNA (adenine37-N6)-methyltransferase